LSRSVEISPSALIKHAKALIPGSSRGRPTATNLRRAVSAAYYALFHQVSLIAAASVMPSVSPSVRRDHARRVDHGPLNGLCAAIGGGKGDWKNLHENEKLRQICNDFVDLYGARHRADYDHNATFTKQEALELILRSEQSLRAVARLRSTPDGQLFLAQVWANAGAGKQRRT